MRARNIKPGFFENEDLVELPFACRLFFIGLWCLADRDGRLEDRPKKIKLALAPLDDVNTNEILEQLRERKLIVRYSVNGEKCISIPNFLKHQRPHHNEKRSVIPPPPENQPLNDFNLKTLDTAQALIDEKITEDEAGMSKKAAFALLDESTCDHGEKHFALNPDSLNPDSLNKEPTAKTSDQGRKDKKATSGRPIHFSKAYQKEIVKKIETAAKSILIKFPEVFKFVQFNCKAKVHPGALCYVLEEMNKQNGIDDYWAYGIQLVKKYNWNFKDADRIAEGEKDKVDFNKIVKAIEVVMKRGSKS